MNGKRNAEHGNVKQINLGGYSMKNEKEKVIYAKPTVLAVTKEKSNFSDGCGTRTGMMCMTCRCS